MKSTLSLIAGLACMFASQAVNGQITFVDADTTNTSAFDPGITGTNFVDLSGNSTDAASTDNLWLQRGFGEGTTVFTSNDNTAPPQEDAPLLITSVAAPAAGTYELYGYFWGAGPEWALRASVNAADIDDGGTFGDLSDDSLSAASTLFVEGTTPSTQADVNDFAAGTFTVDEDLTDGIVTESNRILYQASLGQVTVGAGGTFEVFIDDFESTIGGNERTWFDGIGFQAVAAAVPEPGSGMVALLFGSLIGLRRRR